MTDNMSPILDLRVSTNHPLSLRYSEVFNQALLQGCFAHGRAQPSLPLSGATPFVDAARVALAHGVDRADTLDVMIAGLTRYYELVRPASAAQWLGVGSGTELATSPPWAAVFPWRARSIASYRKAYEDAALAENRAVGREVGISDGWLFCGPVSQEKIRIEAERILYVLRRIRDTGYVRSDDPDGDVKATALVNNDHEWRWLITAGNHRAAAAAALGYYGIPIRVNLVISRGEASFWKHVVDKLFLLDEALTVFDNIFHGNPGDLVGNWIAAIRT